MNRRIFLGMSSALAAGAGMAVIGSRPAWAAPLAEGAPHAEKIGWRLACQAYSFNRYTFQEAVEKNASLGLRYIEAYPGQSLSAEHKDVKVGESMTAEQRAAAKKLLSDAGVMLVNFGVTGLSRAEDQSRKTFEFAADMGIETIVSEPDPDAMDTVEKLCDEYKINVALHNHPRPSRYWNPDTVLEVCRDRSQRIGSCADTGHWMRSDLDPLEQLRKLEGRIISLHFKDLNTFGRDAHDVPWGTGKADVAALLKELKRQNFQGVFSIEYEYNWTTSLPEIAQCVKAFDKLAAEMATA